MAFRHPYDDTDVISIHAPREGSDVARPGDGSFVIQFQSTLPVRGATIAGQEGSVYQSISIHAPREGSDTR